MQQTIISLTISPPCWWHIFACW